MAKNIIIANAEYSDVPAVTFPMVGGGTAQFNDAKVHDFMGDNPVFVKKIYDQKIYLKNTNYPSWTPSTTAGSIIATKSLTDEKFTADMTQYEYMIEWLWDAHMAYPAGQTYKVTVDRGYGAQYQTIHRRPYGLDNFAAENFNYNYCTSLYTSSQYIIYWNSSGTHTWTTTAYGVYSSGLNAATLSNTTNNSITVTPKTPTVSAKCHASYFSTTRAGEVDQENSYIKIIGNLYRMDLGSCALRQMWGKAVHLYNNPL